jgi:hypothetical protein
MAERTGAMGCHGVDADDDVGRGERRCELVERQRRLQWIDGVGGETCEFATFRRTLQVDEIDTFKLRQRHQILCTHGTVGQKAVARIGLPDDADLAMPGTSQPLIARAPRLNLNWVGP